MKTVITVLFVAFLISGCSDNYDLTPVDSGMVEVHSHGGVLDQPHTVELSSTQIKGLSDWFSGHRTGWARIIEDTPPGIMVYLKHGDANAAYVNVLGYYVYSAGRRRLLTSTEREEIRAILVPGLRP